MKLYDKKSDFSKERIYIYETSKVNTTFKITTEIDSKKTSKILNLKPNHGCLLKDLGLQFNQLIPNIIIECKGLHIRFTLNSSETERLTISFNPGNSSLFELMGLTHQTASIELTQDSKSKFWKTCPSKYIDVAAIKKSQDFKKISSSLDEWNALDTSKSKDSHDN